MLVQFKYILSEDTQLLVIGDKMKILYAKEYWQIKELIVTKAQTSYMKATFVFFDKIVLAGVNGRTATEEDEGKGSDQDEELVNMLQRLDVDDSGSDTDDADVQPAANLQNTAHNPQALEADDYLSQELQDIIAAMEPTGMAGPSRPRVTTQQSRTLRAEPILDEEEEIVAPAGKEARGKAKPKRGSAGTVCATRSRKGKEKET
jgi:hypothetical protein